MHLLLVCARWELIGGSERYALAIADKLHKRGHELTLVHASGTPPTGSGWHALRLDEIWRPQRGLASRQEFVRHISASGAELAFILTPTDTRVVELLADTLPFVRFVQDHTLFCPGMNKLLANGERCSDPFGLACIERYFLADGCNGFKPVPDSNRLLKPFTRLEAKRRELAAARRAARLIVASSYMQAELVRAGIAPERIVTLPYFTDSPTSSSRPSALPPATTDYLAQHSSPLLLTPARLTLPDKGVDYLLTALGQVDSAFHAIIAGSGPAESWLRQKARAEGLAERVHFTGWLAADQLEALYAACSMVVFPSIWNEPFGLVGIEAMAHAKPVVAFEGGGVSDWLVNGVTGSSVPVGDVQALAREIDALVSNPAQARALGAAGHKRVDELFRAPRHVDRLESLFEDVVALAR